MTSCLSADLVTYIVFRFSLADFEFTPDLKLNYSTRYRFLEDHFCREVSQWLVDGLCDKTLSADHVGRKYVLATYIDPDGDTWE